MSSHHLDGITDRPEAVLFDEMDWHVAGGLDTLRSVVSQRETAEQEILERYAGGESKTKIASDLKVSKRQINNVCDIWNALYIRLTLMQAF